MCPEAVDGLEGSRCIFNEPGGLRHTERTEAGWNRPAGGRLAGIGGPTMSTALAVDEIRAKIAAGEYRLTAHATTRLVQRNLPESWLLEAAPTFEVVEDYPDDKYSPSCLLLGFQKAGVPLHVQVSRARTPRVIIITVYIPSPDEWIDHRRRRSTGA